jgi:hypothetical protein
VNKTIRSFAAAVAVLVLVCLPAAAEAPNLKSLKAFEGLLAARPAEGQPIERFEAFRDVDGAAALAAGILTDKTRAAQWSNAVFALGAIGDDAAETALEEFIKTPVDPLSTTTRLHPITFEAKVDSFFALGYLIVHAPEKNRNAKARAWKFLDEGTGISGPLYQKIHWQSPRHASQPARDAYLVTKVQLVMKAVRQQQGPNTGQTGECATPHPVQTAQVSQ